MLCPQERGGEDVNYVPYYTGHIDETVTINNSETAEVQGEATARREQCRYIVHNLLSVDKKKTDHFKRKWHHSLRTHQHQYTPDMQKITCEVLLNMCLIQILFFLNPAVIIVTLALMCQLAASE